mmetsp:Transcript_88826/g.236472  ORF Transcript_88826/g.236472 Transcript_88826/m.236472 type:complete len:211 (-) Transcript_88826:1933-2565(-)
MSDFPRPSSKKRPVSACHLDSFASPQAKFVFHDRSRGLEPGYKCALATTISTDLQTFHKLLSANAKGRGKVVDMYTSLLNDKLGGKPATAYTYSRHLQACLLDYDDSWKQEFELEQRQGGDRDSGNHGKEIPEYKQAWHDLVTAYEERYGPRYANIKKFAQEKTSCSPGMSRNGDNDFSMPSEEPGSGDERQLEHIMGQSILRSQVLYLY